MSRTGWIVLAAVCVLMGVVALTLEGIGITRQETILEMGPLEVTSETEDRLPLPVWLGGGLIVLGVVLALVGVTRKAG